MINRSKKVMITIVTPSFNREDLIGQTLESLQNQTFINWECLVVDDGSKDNTISIVNSYLNKDTRIRLIERNRLPKGAPTCRNMGLENAKGKYVIFLDSDDILLPHALETRVGFMESHLDKDFCVAPGVRGEFPINSETDYYLISSKTNKEGVLEEFFKARIPWITLNPTYKREVLLNNNIFWDENLKGFQDIDFHVNCLINNLNFGYTSKELKPDCIWRAHSHGNIGSDIESKTRNIKLKLYILEKYSKSSLCSNFFLKPLTATLLKEYLFNKELKNSVEFKTILLRISKLDLDLKSSTIKLCKFYRLSYQNRIRVLPSVFRYLIEKSKDSYIFMPNSNNHYLKYKYSFDNLSSNHKNNNS